MSLVQPSIGVDTGPATKSGDRNVLKNLNIDPKNMSAL
jgi:hypothetical protein